MIDPDAEIAALEHNGGDVLDPPAQPSRRHVAWLLRAVRSLDARLNVLQAGSNTRHDSIRAALEAHERRLDQLENPPP